MVEKYMEDESRRVFFKKKIFFKKKLFWGKIKAKLYAFSVGLKYGPAAEEERKEMRK